MVEPTTVDDSEAIQARNVVTATKLAFEKPKDELWSLRGKERCTNVTDKTTHSMDRENVECVITPQKVLQLGGIVACSTTDDTIDDSRPCGNIARARSNRDKSGYDSRTEANCGPLAFESVIDDAPSHATDTSSKVCDDGSHDSANVCTECRASIEAEPSYPQENSSNDNVGYIVWSVV